MALQEYKMTDVDYEKLIEACKPVALIALNCGMPSSPQENANRAWCALGDKMGFDGMTVQPCAKGNFYFFAEPKPDPLID